MVMSLYRFHVYYHVRQVLKRLRVPLPHQAGFNAVDNPYTNEEFLKICEDYDDPIKYRDKKFFGTHQGWSDYINQDSMTHWIIEKSQGFTDVGLLKISCLVLNSQASARPGIIGNTAPGIRRVH